LNLAWFAVGFALAALNGAAGDFAFRPGTPAARDVMLRIGAQSPSTLEQGEWWRLLTCCFVHFGLLHLGMNMYFLYALGGMVESMWGHGRFLVLYPLAGFAGRCALAIRSSGAGASGALWGVMVAAAGGGVRNGT